MRDVSFKNVIIIISLVLLGIQTSLYKGYGDDLDSHGLILSFNKCILNFIIMVPSARLELALPKGQGF